MSAYPAAICWWTRTATVSTPTAICISTGGTILVCGPTGNGNGALDYDGSCEITGGILVAAGSSGMAEAPGSSSSQCSLMVTYSSTQPAGTPLALHGR